VTSLVGGTASRLRRKPYPEWRSLFSYPEYNQVRASLQPPRCSGVKWEPISD
jgi:hypothetical protein